jgi:hypothetical protein
MTTRGPIKPAIVRENSQVAGLQDQVDALSGFFFPTSAKLEAKFDVAMKVGKDRNVYELYLLVAGTAGLLLTPQ